MGEEKGTFKVSRKNEGGLWKTEISTSSGQKSFPKRLIPLFSINAESDSKTKMHSSYKGTYGTLSFNIDRVTGEKLAAEVDFNGKKYSVVVSLNKAAMSADVVVNAGGKELKLTGQVSKTDSWKMNINGDVNGPVDVTMLIKKDFTEAKAEVSHKNMKYLQLRLKGKRNSDGSFKTKAKFSLMGGKVATGEFEAEFADNTFHIVLKPANFDEIDLTVYFKPTYSGPKYSGASFGYQAKKAGAVMVKYDGVHKRTNDHAKYDASLKTELQVSEESMMYPTFCKMGAVFGSGCFKTRTMELTGFVDKINKNKLMNKFAFGIKNTKDGETRLDASINTVRSPYELKIVSPRLMRRIGSNELTITADHQPGKSLAIESSYQKFKFFFKHGSIPDGKNIFAEISKAGESFLKYDLNLKFKKDASAINMGLASQFDVNEASMFYPVFCSYASGCFKQRKAEFSIFIDLVNKNALINKFDIHGNILKDGEKVGELEVSATHNLGQSLEITTNFNKLKSFSVKKTGGNMREVKLNGKLLFKGEITKGDRSFKQQVELGNGQKMAITVSWEKEVLDVSSVRNNGIKFNIAGNNVNVDFKANWDLSNPR